MTGEQIKTPISLNVSSKNGRIVVSGYGSWVGNWMEKAMATHSSTLSGKVPWMEEPGRLQSTGSLGVRHDFTFTFMHWRRKWHHTPVFCLENPRDGRARWAAVYGVAQSRTWLKRFSSSSMVVSYLLLLSVCCEILFWLQHVKKT